MTDWVREVLNRHGQNVTVCDTDGELQTKAFLQPVTERGELVPDAVTGIGYMDGRLWLYLGQTVVSPGERLRWNGLEFQVRSSRPYYIGESLTYWWASLEQAREAAE